MPLKVLFVILYNADACTKAPGLFVYWRFIGPATDATSTTSSLE